MALNLVRSGFATKPSPGRGIDQEDQMSSFKLNIPRQYIYVLLSVLYLFHGLGLDSILIWLSFSLSYAILAAKTP